MSQLRSLIFWLLLAATISIDAVAFSHFGSNSSAQLLGADFYRIVICDALLASQISIVCIWAALGTDKILWLPVLCAVFTATLVSALFTDPSDTFVSACRLYLSLYGFEAALLLAALWLFRGSRYWRRRAASPMGWQFSLAHLLLMMTTVAVLATVMRTGPFADESKWVNIGFACSVVFMALVSVVVWSRATHWILRLAATLGTALILGAVFSFAIDSEAPSFYVFGTHYLVQAIVLSSWLGWGAILPARINSANCDDPRLRAEH
jgi:hypothetical protein